MVQGTRRFFFIQIAFTCLVLVLSFYLFLQLSADLKRSSEKTNKEILSHSYDIIKRMKMQNQSSFFFPLQSIESKESESVVLEAVAWYLGKNKIWCYPKEFLFPPFNEPSNSSGDVVTLSSAKRMFLLKVEDGRTAIMIFKTSEYNKVFSKFIIISFIALILGLSGVLLLFITLKSFKTDEEIAPPLFVSQQENPVDALIILKKAMADLREKNLFLETELRKEKKRAKSVSSVLENLSSAINTGFIRFDSEGNLQSFNPIAKNLIGLPILFRIGENFKKMFKNNTSLLDFIENSIVKREIATIDEIKGFQNKLLFIISIPILDEMNHFEGILLIIEDKSEFYSMQQIVKERETLSRLGEVAAGVAHEIRNGLNVLSGELRLLRKNYPESFQERTARIENEIGQMEKVVKDILYYAKPIPIQKETIVCSEFINELTETLKEIFPDTVFSHRSEVETFIADRDSLFRALFNIMKNGAEAAGEGGEVFLSFQKKDHSIVFHIEDSGKGLSEENSRDIFALFTTYKKDGTGLGLPIAKKIARENGGELKLSEPLKLKGAAFDFIISIQEDL